MKFTIINLYSLGRIIFYYIKNAAFLPSSVSFSLSVAFAHFLLSPEILHQRNGLVKNLSPLFGSRFRSLTRLPAFRLSSSSSSCPMFVIFFIISTTFFTFHPFFTPIPGEPNHQKAIFSLQPVQSTRCGIFGISLVDYT